MHKSSEESTLGLGELQTAGNSFSDSDKPRAPACDLKNNNNSKQSLEWLRRWTVYGR